MSLLDIKGNFIEISIESFRMFRLDNSFMNKESLN